LTRRPQDAPLLPNLEIVIAALELTFIKRSRPSIELNAASINIQAPSDDQIDLTICDATLNKIKDTEPRRGGLKVH